MRHHLLPCSCSCRISVTASQAGGTARCPACGADVPVPRLGEFVRLEAVEAAPEAVSRAWDAARASVLAGLVVAAVAAAAAGWLRARRADVAPIAVEAIMRAVAAAPVDRVWESWRDFERRGIARPADPEEQRRQRQAGALRGQETVLWVVAAAGGIVAAAGGLLTGRFREA